MVIPFCTSKRESWRPDWRIADSPLVYLDVETTGLHPERGQHVTEVAILDRTNVKLHANPGGEVEERETVQSVLDILAETIPVGHNVTFDLRFLAERAERMGLPMPRSAFIDTLDLARRYEVGRETNYTLGSVASALNLELPDVRHRALPDARLAKSVFEALALRYDLKTLSDARVRRLEWYNDSGNR